MTTLTRILLVYAGVMHLVIGLWELLVYEERAHKSSAWQLLYLYLNEDVWSWAFVLVGFLCLVGAIPQIHGNAGRWAFDASAILFAVWASFSALSWIYGNGATVSGTLQLFYTAVLQLGLARYVLRTNRLAERATEMGDTLTEASEPLQATITEARNAER